MMDVEWSRSQTRLSRPLAEAGANKPARARRLACERNFRINDPLHKISNYTVVMLYGLLREANIDSPLIMKGQRQHLKRRRFDYVSVLPYPSHPPPSPPRKSGSESDPQLGKLNDVQHESH